MYKIFVYFIISRDKFFFLYYYLFGVFVFFDENVWFVVWILVCFFFSFDNLM